MSLLGTGAHRCEPACPTDPFWKVLHGAWWQLVVGGQRCSLYVLYSLTRWSGPEHTCSEAERPPAFATLLLLRGRKHVFLWGRWWGRGWVLACLKAVGTGYWLLRLLTCRVRITWPASWSWAARVPDLIHVSAAVWALDGNGSHVFWEVREMEGEHVLPRLSACEHLFFKEAKHRISYLLQAGLDCSKEMVVLFVCFAFFPPCLLYSVFLWKDFFFFCSQVN